MSNKTRKRIWPAALMSLAVFGVLAAVVALATMQPQSAQAHECDSSTMSAADYAACLRDHQVGGIGSQRSRPRAHIPSTDGGRID